VACAKLLADQKRPCVLVDADLTGTSMADGLRLCAPDVVLSEGSADLDAPPEGYLDRARTLELRAKRDRSSWTSAPPPPPFLNDALIHGPGAASEAGEGAKECDVRSILWEHESRDGVLYLPSSPLRKDIEIALGWLYYEERHAWVQRLTWLLDGMMDQLPHLTDLVVDLPPGLFGFADEVLTLLAHLDDGKPLPDGYPPSWNTTRPWRVHPFLVATQDRNDLAAALPYYLSRRESLPSLTVLLNRRTESIESIVKDLHDRLGGLVTADMVTPIDDLRESLGRLFTGAGDLPLTRDVVRLREALRLTEGEAS
jgi:hypothetical protein